MDEYYALVEKSYPTRLISAAHYTEGGAHPRCRYMIIFRLHAFVRIILESSTRVAPNATKDMYFVNTKDAAMKRLETLTNPLSQT